MASSSRKKQKDYDLLDQVRELRKEEERGRDWLALGLGFSSIRSECKKQRDDHSHSVSISATAASSPSSPFYANQYQQMGLGLEYSNSCLGFDYKEDDEDITPNSWQVDSGSFIGWQMRSVFNDTHNHVYTRRPHLGFWFTLHSITSRNGESALPQIPKAYIRVKDDNVMVLMVQRYLVTKLGLSNEAEVEMSCMGQKLLQWQTLKHVRDRVWMPRMRLLNSTTTLLLESTSPIDYYLLPLHYYRSTDFSLPC